MNASDMDSGQITGTTAAAAATTISTKNDDTSTNSTTSTSNDDYNNSIPSNLDLNLSFSEIWSVLSSRHSWIKLAATHPLSLLLTGSATSTVKTSLSTHYYIRPGVVDIAKSVLSIDAKRDRDYFGSEASVMFWLGEEEKRVSDNEKEVSLHFYLN